MNGGASVLTDCLGWKGIWNRTRVKDPQLLLKGFKEIEDYLKNELAEDIEEHRTVLDGTLMVGGDLKTLINSPQFGITRLDRYDVHQ